MKFCLLASGSRGNSVWVEEGGLAVIIDCGLSFKEFKARALAAGLDTSKIGCVLVSHEHSDHINGVGPLARALKVPVLANKGTIEKSAKVGQVKWERFSTGDVLSLGALKIKTLPIPHDTVDPISFRLESPAGTLGLATDIGEATNLIRHEFRGLRALILEFNHDYHKLMNGPYPWPLKQRVRSRVGHLSNENAAALAAELYHSDLKHLVLAHLSETNNEPKLALEAARRALDEALEPQAANQWKPSPVFEF